MADDKKPDDDDTPVDVPADDAPPAAEDAPAADAPPADAPADAPAPDECAKAMAAELPEAMQVLAQIDVHLSKDTNPENFMKQLIAAVKTKIAHAGGNNDTDVQDEDLEDEDEIPDENQPGSQPANPPSPVLMSQVSALQTRERDLVTRLAGDRRGKLKKRIERLAKKYGADAGNRLLAELRTTHDDQLVAPVSLSSADAGSTLPILLTIETLETAAKQGKFTGDGKGVNLSSAEVVLPPSGPGGDDKNSPPLDLDVVERLSGGRYSQYREKQAAQNGKK